jgi:hypothetical protein
MAQLAGTCQIAFLQAGHAAALLQGASKAPVMPAQQGSLLLSPQSAADMLPAAAISLQAPAAADVLARIAAPHRSTAKRQRVPAAGSRRAAKSGNHKAATSTAIREEEEEEEKDSDLLKFGQEVADQALAKLAASGSPSDCLDMPRVMQLLQPIVDKMQQDNPEALGEPITPEHKAHITRGGLQYEHIEQVCQ